MTELSETELEQVKSVVKKRGSKPASVTANCTATKDEISNAIQHSFQYFNRPIVKSDEECADRLNDYFNQCAKDGQIPTVEGMCLAMGTVRRTVWDWENGSLGPVRANIIKKAKEILASIDASLVSQGKIPQVTYIFRAKNFFGMKDQQDITVRPDSPYGEQKTAEQIAREYEALPE